ncbi:MAG: oligosaccharide flippase family protein [Pyrinomonadaceae bacterium]
MSSLAPENSTPASPVKLIFQNVSLNYVVAGTELLLGLFMLPFNVRHLGQSAYGLWVLVASITVYFSLLDMGYGVAQVRFTAKYRAEGNAKGLNEMASTMFCMFTGIGAVTLLGAIAIAFNLDHVFSLTPSQAASGRIVFLFISAYVALGFPISVFGGIVNGFQRIYLNGVVAFITAVTVAVVNIIILSMGYGIVELVAATTAVRVLSYGAYALNAYRAFPGLHISLRNFRRSRLREMTGFSVFILLIDLANKLNYSTDTIVVGAFIGTAAVAVWAVAQRLIDIVQRITDQLNSVLFPVVVDSSTNRQVERLRNILIQGTRLSLAMVVPLSTGLSVLAEPTVLVWVGPAFAGSIPVIVILSVVVSLRVGSATSAVILKGAGRHRLLAASNTIMAVGNLVLSITLVRWWGLVGVALGTLVPMIVTAFAVTVPAACRRVGISPLQIIRRSVWPVAWPSLIMAVSLIISRTLVPTRWPYLIGQVLLGGTIYLMLFLGLAIGRSEREWYLEKLREIFNVGVPRKIAKQVEAEL